MQQKPKNFDPDVPSGILLINKPEGQTSAQVVAKVKRTLNAKKVGHTGTLDPFATGLVICCINQATKLAQFFLKGDKTYEGVLHLGIDTNTQDKTGEIISQKEPHCNETEISAAFRSFLGQIEQIPPAFSALKHRGVPLYQWARKGCPVQKPPRKVHIYDLTIQTIALPDVYFTVKCSSGTYVRTLCADIGKTLKCGGHLKELCRIDSCGYSIDHSLTYEQMAQETMNMLKSRIVPIADALKKVPKLIAPPAMERQIKNGGRLFRNHFSQEILKQGNILKIVTPDNMLLAVIQWHEESNECKIIRFGLSDNK
ncbi:MAG: tRNA pseudouridine synthase B [Candidatus Magnetoglobus multicellularis str. Araruama]|uniref:tRNA pseudouridine synthase B n=1 Tax=Candidatus Magnetoglobus multicellularis str. Araruama TaxID=890399 RepID=A0A1V1PBD0_9BACT|nr:MAG: tRNA pseudouridine synthase B [Candidatus Magnetoglobus multicellularis str. Araruama]